MLACGTAGIGRFALNTHHLPETWDDFGAAAANGPPPPAGGNGLAGRTRAWQGRELVLYHEPVLLETGGGLKNIEGWLQGEPVLVHNGDIFSTMPLERLIAAHAASGLPVTLALRSEGDAKHIALDDSGTRCIDIRGMLERAAGTHVFSGIYCAGPELLGMLPAGEKTSVIPAFLALAKAGRLGTMVLDDGLWLDLGDRAAYLRAHRELALAPAVHPLAVIEGGAELAGTVVGPGAVVRAGSIVRNSIVWPGCEVAADAVLDECVVFSGKPAGGTHQGQDL